MRVNSNFIICTFKKYCFINGKDLFFFLFLFYLSKGDESILYRLFIHTYVLAYKYASTSRKICIRILWLSQVCTVVRALNPFVKKNGFSTCELQWGGSRYKSLWNRYYLYSLAARPSFTTSWISNHLPGQRTGWRSTSPQTCVAYWKEMHFRFFFFFFLPGWTFLITQELQRLHLSGSAAICNEETHKRQDKTVFGFHALLSLVFFPPPKGWIGASPWGLCASWLKRAARTPSQRADGLGHQCSLLSLCLINKVHNGPRPLGPLPSDWLWAWRGQATLLEWEWSGWIGRVWRRWGRVCAHNGSLPPPHPCGEGESICCRA